MVLPITDQNKSHTCEASVIIVNYNSWEDLKNCLTSLEKDDRRDYEVIVVDNASKDEKSASIQKRFPWTRFVLSQKNLGFGGGNNLGAMYANGQYLAFLNPDTLVEVGWLGSLISALKQNRCTGLATSKILLIDHPQTINTCGNNIHMTGLTLCRGMGKSCNNYSKMEEVSAVSGAAFAISKVLFQEAGGFDEGFFLYMEDTDLSMRIKMAGYRCLSVPDSIVHHDYMLTFGPLKTFYQERNRYWMLLKSLRWPTLIVLLPALLIAELITWGFVLLNDRGHIQNKINAYHWIIRNWAGLMRQRKVEQSKRKIQDRLWIRESSPWIDFRQTSKGFYLVMAEIFFNSFFYIYKGITLLLIWW